MAVCKPQTESRTLGISVK